MVILELLKKESRIRPNLFAKVKRTPTTYKIMSKTAKNHVDSKNVSEVLTDEEIERLLAACGGGTLGTRNRAILALAWKTGLRVSEIFDLRPKDINWTENRIRVRNGKGGRDDFSMIPESVKPFLEIWLVVRSQLGLPANAPLFCAISKNIGAPLHRNYLWNRLQALGVKAGISKKIHPHIFRRTCATQLLNRGASLLHVQSQLRHRSNQTTLRYLKIVEKGQMVEKLKTIGW